MLVRLGALILSGLLLLGVYISDTVRNDSKQNETSVQKERNVSAQKVRGPIVPFTPMLDFDEQYYIEEEKVINYIKAELQRQIDEFLAWRYNEDLAIDAYLWAIGHPQIIRKTPAPARSTVTTGDCSGVAAIIGSGTVTNESSWNPLAENGIYKGCAQIGLPWWNGACSGLNWTDVADQVTCTQIVMNTQGPSAWATTYEP